nr:sulfite reductase [NADPH] flavoprotein alpha-component-like [Nerophis lumbriciformis]
MAQLEIQNLKKEKNLLIITSTYGDGEPPDNAEALYEYLMGDSVESLAGVKFSVLALGDTDREWAERAYELVTCDVEFDEAFEQWKKGVMQAFGGSSSVAVETTPETFEGYGKKNPFPSPVLKNYNLNAEGSERETYHLELSLEGSELEYEAGDALGVVPMNPESAVDELISNLPFKPTEEVPLPGGGEASLREALITSYDIRNLTKRFVETWQAKNIRRMAVSVGEYARHGDLPVIMVGPGTGIAPFRAFIEERAATEAKGKNWLFFGNPHRASDYLYEDELEAYHEKGTLDRLDLAFSRDQEHKVYVQDLMLKSGAELWKWLEMGAHFYVCGDASRMAKDVDAALHQIAQEHGKLSEEDATAHFKEMKKQKKYGRDVY